MTYTVYTQRTLLFHSEHFTTLFRNLCALVYRVQHLAELALIESIPLVGH